MHFSTWIYLRRENKNLQCNCPFLITNWHLSRLAQANGECGCPAPMTEASLGFKGNCSV